MTTNKSETKLRLRSSRSGTIENQNGHLIAHCEGPDQANALIRRFNAHDDLVKALEEMLAAAHSNEAGAAVRRIAAKEQARAALLKASE